MTGTAIVLLLGHPGTGKLTVARELVRQAKGAGDDIELLDNHRAVQVLFSIAAPDPATPLPRALLDRIRDVNLVVLRTIEELAAPERSFVFTHHLVPTPDNERYVAQLAALAEHRGARFVPVVLRCAPEELARRVSSAERRGRKLTDVDLALATASQPILEPPGATHLDISHVDPMSAAARILELAGR